MPDDDCPPGIPPDSKDWTWVLDRICPECGFDASSFDRTEVGAMLRANGREWQLLLTHDPEAARRRRPDRWSTLEYGCHVRDVCVLYLRRLGLMLDQDGPSYPNWDQDATALAERYDLADPEVVAVELVAAAEALAARFDAVAGEQWDRTGFRSDGARFTVESFARYFIHDPVHHLHDVR
jgi:rubredoxin